MSLQWTRALARQRKTLGTCAPCDASPTTPLQSSATSTMHLEARIHRRASALRHATPRAVASPHIATRCRVWAPFSPSPFTRSLSFPLTRPELLQPPGQGALVRSSGFMIACKSYQREGQTCSINHGGKFAWTAVIDLDPCSHSGQGNSRSAGRTVRGSL